MMRMRRVVKGVYLSRDRRVVVQRLSVDGSAQEHVRWSAEVDGVVVADNELTKAEVVAAAECHMRLSREERH
jgi:hypothetical protein